MGIHKDIYTELRPTYTKVRMFPGDCLADMIKLPEQIQGGRSDNMTIYLPTKLEVGDSACNGNPREDGSGKGERYEKTRFRNDGIALCAAMVRMFRIRRTEGYRGQIPRLQWRQSSFRSSGKKGLRNRRLRAENKKIDKLNVYLLPSREPERDCNGNRTIKGDVKDRTRQGRVYR